MFEVTPQRMGEARLVPGLFARNVRGVLVRVVNRAT